MTPCTDLRKSLGVYVVGAIDPAERSRLEGHLATCPACRDELAAMAGLPALLGRVTEEQISHVAGPPDELLDSLLAKAAAERPTATPAVPLPLRRRLWAPLAAAAAVVLVAGFLLGGLVMGGTRTVAHTPPPSASPSSSSAAELVSATDPKTHVSTKIGMTGEEWGMALSIEISNAPGGERCSLVVVDRAGHRDTAASWQIESGGYGDYLGSTMVFRPDVKALQVVTASGRTLVTVPVPQT